MSTGGAAAPPLTIPRRAETMAKSGAENFPVALALLGPRRRRQLMAIYGFARLVDDIGDELKGDRPAMLDWAEQELDRACSGGRPAHPTMAALAEAIREASLPEGPFRRLIEANRQDQRVHSYETFGELLAYCHLSAAPVGELVLHVFGAATPDRIALSDQICAGLQVTEHIQDIREDHRRGRVYVPEADLERFGCAPAELDTATPSPALLALVGLQVRRARALLAEGAPLVGRLRGRGAIAVAGYLGGGRAALGAIEAAGCDVFSGGPRPTRLQSARALLQAVISR
jgi:squalene synthase HpnC